MSLQYQYLDGILKRHLESFAEADKDYWSFRGKAVREHAHAYFQYPAMMVPQMQGSLIQIVLDVEPKVKSVFDPFVGSGTVMTEAMLRGLDFTGWDINPLAILLCRAKMGPFYEQALREKCEHLLSTIEADTCTTVEVAFPGLTKWFQPTVALERSKIRRAILREPYIWARRFFWVALAETVRVTSNSRISTFKLHIRPKEEVERRAISPIETFKVVLEQNRSNLSAQRKLLIEKRYIPSELYQGSVNIELRDATKPVAISEDAALHDLLITSPPYGDNRSTVPYGQHSYLPLQWINRTDIDANVDDTWLATTYTIDSRSLGGTLVRAIEGASEVFDYSSTFKQTIEALKNEPRDRAMRVAAFCRDFNCSLEPILAMLKPNAYMIWTVGNRKVAGRPVPIDEILSELLIAKGATPVSRFQRTIPNKRMAVKNAIASTMATETVLIMRKGEA